MIYPFNKAEKYKPGSTLIYVHDRSIRHNVELYLTWKLTVSPFDKEAVDHLRDLIKSIDSGLL
jgi:hypothetical protein